MLRTARLINWIDQQSNIMDYSIYEPNFFHNLNSFMVEKKMIDNTTRKKMRINNLGGAKVFGPLFMCQFCWQVLNKSVVVNWIRPAIYCDYDLAWGWSVEKCWNFVNYIVWDKSIDRLIDMHLTTTGVP